MTELVKKYLAENNFSEQKESFEELFNSHPNYPSVYAITDTLDLLAIENVAVKIPKEQFHDLPGQFLTFLNKEFVLVTKSRQKIAVETHSKMKSLSSDDFLMDWGGVVIAIEPNTENKPASFSFNFQSLKYVLPILALIALALLRNEFSLWTVFFSLTSLLGFLVGVFIVQESLGIKNETVSKLCNMSSEVSCSKVIQSGKSKIFNTLNFSELPLMFFGSSFTALLFLSEPVVAIIGWLSVMSLPVIAYSIWLQKVELKKWCTLCLAVSFLLIIQATGFISAQLYQQKIAGVTVGVFLISALVFVSLWMLVRPILKRNIELENVTNKLTKFKRNFKIFQSQSKEIPQEEGFEKLQGLNFGSTHAEVQLSVIVSPSCGHCHTAFQQAYELCQKFPEKIGVTILFNINPENQENPYRIVVETILTINNIDSKQAKAALIDWHINQPELELWLQNWKVSAIDMQTNNQIFMQYEWCAKNNFNYTPVKLLNGKQFPSEYEIEELRFFLNEFAEAKQVLAY
ncbi:vitamin K epoxide reductase family protein [Flavobacterium sp. SM15]|uniref:vitamin K epoxide reductase family protein n=1 Tax=Flavobacterium sp. SM15 TaxID=2908005 RepID=UPI001EDC5A3C|nr:vitamin K epoxide reductase family protein [Flavobacterium sp. SM15]MCG2610068.1 vitamin K epoxide reductase family protein [Flavobacterium sp. SM15]